MRTAPSISFARPDVDGMAVRRDPPRRSACPEFVRRLAMPDIDAVQARAVDDPAWFWGAAADDLASRGSAGRRRCSIVTRRGVRALVDRRCLQLRPAAVDPRAATDPDGRGSPGKARTATVRRLTRRRAQDARSTGPPACCAELAWAGRRVGIFLPMLLETVVAVLALGRLGAIFTPIFSGYAAPAVASRLARLRGNAAHHSRRILRRGSVIAAQADGRRGGGRGTHRRTGVRGAQARRQAAPDRAVDARPRSLVGRGDGDPAAEAAGRRGRGHRSRDAVHGHLHVGHDGRAEGRGPRPRRLPDQGAPRTSPTRSTCGRATACSGSPTSAG